MFLVSCASVIRRALPEVERYAILLMSSVLSLGYTIIIPIVRAWWQETGSHRVFHWPSQQTPTCHNNLSHFLGMIAWLDTKVHIIEGQVTENCAKNSKWQSF